MKYNTLFTFPYEGSWFKFLARQDPDTGTIFRNYYQDKQVKFKLIAGDPKGTRPVLYSTEKFSTFDRIGNIVDAKGESIFGDTGYEIATVVPVVNPFGYIDGYAYGLQRLTVPPSDSVTVERPKN
jgi:hypothetical protein